MFSDAVSNAHFKNQTVNANELSSDQDEVEPEDEESTKATMILSSAEMNEQSSPTAISFKPDKQISIDVGLFTFYETAHTTYTFNSGAPFGPKAVERSTMGKQIW